MPSIPTPSAATRTSRSHLAITLAAAATLCLCLIPASTLAPAPASAAPPTPAAAPDAATPDASPPVRLKKTPWSQVVADKVQAELTRVSAGADLLVAERRLEQLFDQTIAWADPNHPDALTQAAFGLRLVRQVQQAPAAQRKAVFDFLYENQAFAAEFIFAIRPVVDDVPKAYAILAQLIETRAQVLPRFPSLAAAIAVVYDQTSYEDASARDENTPMRLFDYFASQDGRLVYSTRVMPTELAVHLVDVKITIPEMLWAMDKYGGNRWVGRVYNTIREDDAYLRRGAARNLEGREYTLENIRRYGGASADRAHFAAMAAKAIGVPSIIITGKGGSIAHSWVGALVVAGGRAQWDLTNGRPDVFERVRGLTVDPQSGRALPDGFIVLQSASAATPPDRRYAAAALADAVLRVHTWRENAQPIPAPAAEGLELVGVLKRPRTKSVDTQLELLEIGLRQNPAYLDGWTMLQVMARRGDLDDQHTRRWAGVIERLTGDNYPDFTFEMLAPMIDHIDDPRTKIAAWESLYERFRRLRRPDLAAETRLRQAEIYKDSQAPEMALRAYQDIIRNFGDDAPQAVTAVRASVQLLEPRVPGDDLLEFLKDAWRRIPRPRDLSAGLAPATNWHQIGSIYRDTLIRLGDPNRARSVQRQLDSVTRDRG